MERLPEEFNLRELFHKVEEKTPYTIVALQECERMNSLTREMRTSLKELNLGLKVSFTPPFFIYISKFSYSIIHNHYSSNFH